MNELPEGWIRIEYGKTFIQCPIRNFLDAIIEDLKGLLEREENKGVQSENNEKEVMSE